MPKLKVEAQSSASRIEAAASGKSGAGGNPKKAPVDFDPTTDSSFADTRDFNDTFGWERAAGVPARDLDYLHQQLREKYVFGFNGDWNPDLPGVQNIQTQIDTGLTVAGWEDGVITWGFYDFRTKIGFNGNHEGKGYFPFTDEQKAVAYASIAAWDELIPVEFRYEDFNEHDARQWAHGDSPDILFANTTTGPAQAWAYYPGGSGHNVFARIGSDVWIGADPSNYFNLWDGGYGTTTQVHELGHALGLSHPGAYNFGPGFDVVYQNGAEYFQDSLQYSIMSYWDGHETGAQYIDWNLMRFAYTTTPMVHDIWVIQQKYGVDEDTRIGDTVYGWNASDGVPTGMSFEAGEMMPVFTIWDALGNDTLDLSGYYTPSVIDLREGAYSSAGGVGAYDPDFLGQKLTLEQINANNEAFGTPNRTERLYEIYFNGNWSDDGGATLVNDGVSWFEISGTNSQYLMEQNIGIAYGAIIENAIGGHGNDRINGNQATNEFTGNDGADTFVIADYSGVISRPTGDVTINDISVDSIMDFDRGEGDKIDVGELGVTAVGELTFDDATDTVTVIATGEQFKILGASDIQASDFVFA